jgi:hypothetical protein
MFTTEVRPEMNPRVVAAAARRDSSARLARSIAIEPGDDGEV